MEFATLVLGFLIAWIINGITFFISKFNFWVDIDKKQKSHAVHTGAVPRIGGLGIFLSTFFISIVSYPQLWKFLYPGALAFLIGFIEDVKKNIHPKLRLGIVFLASVIAVVLLNVKIHNIGFVQLPAVISILLTIIAIAGYTNAINIIDGLNGLAAGISATFFLFLGVTFYEYGYTDLSFLCFSVIAGIVGFLVFNFPYGKIFLGDGGAYFLGFLCAVLSIKLINLVPEISPWFPFMLGVYPVWEVLFSAYRRMKKGRHPFYPDKLHLHTLVFYRITRSNPKASAILLVINFVFSFIAFMFKSCTTCLIVEFLVFVILYLVFYKYVINTAKLSSNKN